MPNFNARSRFIDDIPADIIDLRGDAAPGGYGGNFERPARTVTPTRSGGYIVNDPPKPVQNFAAKAPFQVGDRVRHAKFGVGVCIACNPIKDDFEVTVAFPGVTGIKKLVQKLAKLEKVEA
jgi:DNA helicase-2/ATP-dependent DNA helicase PcrA